jgi:two-component system, OmpR family, KDP operon response regulator KdpE
MIFRGSHNGGSGEGAVPEIQTLRRAARPQRELGHFGERPRPMILVVEDDPHDREIYGRMLAYNGFDVVFAGTGAAAVRAAAQHRATLVLLDLRLPDMTGLEVLAALRQQPGYAATPVIALSGLPRQRVREDVERAGCLRYMEKPASPVAVLHEVEAVIGKPPLPGVGRPPQVTEG